MWQRLDPREAFDEATRERLGVWLSISYFGGGFLFDALTIGRHVNLYTLAFVGLYALVVAVCMVARARRWFESRRTWIDGALHFSLGATFSALVVLYFRSASHAWGLLTVSLLVGAMVWNEFAAHGRPRRSLIWAIYAASLVMYFNFLFPFLFGSISSLFFYGSILLTMGTLWGIRHLARIPDHSLLASGVFSAVLALLYLFGAIPPVPLVMKQEFPCVDAEKRGGEYVCQGGDQGLLVDLGLTAPTVRYRPGERVSVMSAVAAPRGVEANLEHRWSHWDGSAWKRYDTIDVSINGGRKAGWRFYSYKGHMKPGTWRVETAAKGGSVLSYVVFRAAEVGSDAELERAERKLQ